jgi:putative sigma-54 modulation protein
MNRQETHARSTERRESFKDFSRKGDSAMNLTVSGHHVAVTPPLRTYLQSKLERVTRHFDHVIDVSVILSVEKLRQKAEVTVHVRGKDIFVEAGDSDLYAAIDALADKLDRQVLRYKDRVKAHPHDALKHQADPGEADGL